MISKYFKLTKKEKLTKESNEEKIYRMYKDKEPIEIIMRELNISKMEVIAIIQQKKKEKRGE